MLFDNFTEEMYDVLAGAEACQINTERELKAIEIQVVDRDAFEEEGDEFIQFLLRQDEVQRLEELTEL